MDWAMCVYSFFFCSSEWRACGFFRVKGVWDKDVHYHLIFLSYAWTFSRSVWLIMLLSRRKLGTIRDVRTFCWLIYAWRMISWYSQKKRSTEGVLKIFEDFAEMSGLKIILEKSTLYTAGISEAQEEDILIRFPFATVSCLSDIWGSPSYQKDDGQWLHAIGGEG